MHEIPERIITPRQWWFNRLIWSIIAVVFVVDITWATALGWSYGGTQIFIFLAVVSVVGLLSWFFSKHYVRDEFSLVLQLVLQLICFTTACALLNYVSSTLKFPLYDEQFIAIDRALGFDWHAYVWWVRERPILSWLSTISYNSAEPQLIFLMLLLFFMGRLEHLQRTMFCFLIGAIITCILAALFPAVAGYIHFNIDPMTLPGNHPPAAARVHESELFALRDGTFHTINLQFKGLVTFPSFHTTFGIILAYAAWPFKWLRWPFVVLNILLILSIPVDGGHYLIDGIGGALIAFLSIWWAYKIMPVEKAA